MGGGFFRYKQGLYQDWKDGEITHFDNDTVCRYISGTREADSSQPLHISGRQIRPTKAAEKSMPHRDTK